MDILSIIIYILFIPIAYGLWLPLIESFGKKDDMDKVVCLTLSVFGPMSLVAYALVLLIFKKESQGFRLW